MRTARALLIMDDDGHEVALDVHEASSLYAATGRLEAATVSACPECRSCVLATVAFVDVIDASPPHSRSGELVELADEAPTLHLYVVDVETDCGHMRWLDPLSDEWSDVVEADEPHARR